MGYFLEIQMGEISFRQGKPQGKRAMFKSALLGHFRSFRSQNKTKTNNNARVISHYSTRKHDHEFVPRMKKIPEREQGYNLQVMRNHITSYDNNRNKYFYDGNKNDYYDDNDDKYYYDDKKHDEDGGVDEYEQVSATLSIEERLSLLKKIHKRQSSWCPALESIPE